MAKNELPQFSIRQLLEAGVHFGHKTMRRNPKMTRYIHTNRNGVSIIDLNKTANLLHNSLKVVHDIAKNNGRILFVATKKQAIDPVAEAAKRCGQYYVNFRWLGGMLTNWKTISQSIKTLNKIEEQLSDTEVGYKKKEKLVLERDRMKLEQTLGGIKNMGGYPDLVFVIDTHKEALAIAEAKKLNIPIMAILDSNCDPDGITFPIPGNDDSAKSIKLYCRLISDAIISGIKENMIASGLDVSKLEGDGIQNIAELRNAISDKKSAAKKHFAKTESESEVSDDEEGLASSDAGVDGKVKKEIIKKTEAKKEFEASSKKPAQKGFVAKGHSAKKPAPKKPAAKKPAAKK